MTHPYLHFPAPPWEQNLEQVWSPIVAGASRQGLGLSLHSGSKGARAHTHARVYMYMGNLCESMYKG